MQFIDNPMEIEPEMGQIVAAKENHTSKFNRAEIISQVDDQHFNVCFIDFGSRKTVHRSNIVQPSKLQVIKRL